MKSKKIEFDILRVNDDKLYSVVEKKTRHAWSTAAEIYWVKAGIEASFNVIRVNNDLWQYEE